MEARKKTSKKAMMESMVNPKTAPVLNDLDARLPWHPLARQSSFKPSLLLFTTTKLVIPPQLNTLKCLQNSHNRLVLHNQPSLLQQCSA